MLQCFNQNFKRPPFILAFLFRLQWDHWALFLTCRGVKTSGWKKLHSYIKAEIEFQTSGILHNKRSLLFWFRQSLFSIFKFVHSSSNSFILFSSCYAVECTLFNRITLTISLMILHFEVQLEVFEMMRILSTKWVNHTFENILIAYFSSEMTSVYAIWKLLLKKKDLKGGLCFEKKSEGFCRW